MVFSLNSTIVSYPKLLLIIMNIEKGADFTFFQLSQNLSPTESLASAVLSVRNSFLCDQGSNHEEITGKSHNYALCFE